MNIRTRIASAMVGAASFIPAGAQTTPEVVSHTPIVKGVVKDTVEIKNKISKDVSLRTFQFLNGNNLTALGAGFGKNYKKKTTAYIAPLAGYDSSNKQPWVGAFGFIDKRYSNKPDAKVWLSRELYGEFLKEKGVFDSKLAYTPVKLNSKLSKKVSLSFDPRMAVHINGDGLTPQVETLTTISAPINKNLSGYALFQTYDTANLFKSGAEANMGINGGIVYTF